VPKGGDSDRDRVGWNGYEVPTLACDPERVEKGGRRLKIPFPKEGTGSGHNAAGMSDCEDKPHTSDDRVLFRAADG